MNETTFRIIIHRDSETDSYWATCPVLKGCNTQGDTLEEVKTNMLEAIALCLDGYVPELIIEDSVTMGVANA
jgi:predicted RNase H-like HicB family nuclease